MKELLHKLLPMVTKPVAVGEMDTPTALLALLIGGTGQALSLLRFRLYWRFCHQLAPLVGDRSCILELSQHSRMKVSLADPYWARLIARSYEYESDFKDVLSALVKTDYAFIDGGANFGYWSILVSDPALGCKPVVAIEAMATTYEGLLENSALNGDRFTCLHRAISDQSGRTAMLKGVYHSDVGIDHASENRPGAMTGSVETITLDDVCAQHLSAHRKVVLKLDVEGGEVRALDGARRLLAERDVLLYYEDHGNDPTCRATRYVLEELEFSAFYATPEGLFRIERVSDLKKIKTRKTLGYNLFACKSGSDFAEILRTVDRNRKHGICPN